MKVERDIEGIALPFVAGVLITAYAGRFITTNSKNASCCDLSLISFLALVAIAIAITCLLSRNSWADLPFGKASMRMFVCIAIFGCGVLCAVSGLCTDIDLPPSRIEILARRFGDSMGHAIDSIPFQSAGTSAIIKALLTGDRSSLSPDITAAFRDSGASHILALSGLHLGIIYMIFSKVSAFLGNGIYARRLRSPLLICLCGFYTLATGAGASIMRAFLFIFLNETAKLSGRHKSLPQVLSAAALIQLIISPLSILSISFQLSYAAMAGIAYIFPWLKGFWPEDSSSTLTGQKLTAVVRWIWSSAALSISCQLTTGPLAYIYFGTFPKYFLLTNMLALPLTGILIPAAVLTLFLSAIGCCPGLVIYITDALARLLTWILTVISTLSCE